jgi:ATP-dependent Lon protease
LDYLVPQQIREQGLSDSPPEFTAEALSKIIRGYTREAGTRDLEQHIASICREIAAEFVHHKKTTRTIAVTPDLVQKYLGPSTYYLARTGEKNRIGVGTGLICNKGIGDIIFVEAVRIKGLIKKVEHLFMGVTFAEAGEFDTARVLLRNTERPQEVQRISPAIRNRSATRVPRRI